MKLKIALGLFAVLLAYLLFWPIPYAPAAWEPPPPAPRELNDALKAGQLLHPELHGPEAFAFDAQGRLVTGLRDGRLVRIEGEKTETIATLKGRLLGLKFAPDGTLYVCESSSGLMSFDGTTWKTLSGGFKFADDLDFGADGSIYFSDASARNDLDHYVEDLVEHQTTGRLLRWKDGVTTVVADGFSFANGVAFGPTRDWLVLAETGGYRLWKVHVPDGQKEVFAVLPGFPDNVTWSAERQVFWVAIGSPRNGLIDALAGLPFLRGAVLRLPKAVQPKPIRHAMVLAFDANGKLVHDLQWKDAAAYSPVASALEHDGALYLGSYLIDGYVKLPLP